MLRAAATARWAYDFPLAERLARAARDDGAGFEAALLAAQLAYLQGRGLEAEQALAPLAVSARDDVQRGRVALARLECAIFLGHIDDGLRIAEDAEERIADEGWRDQVTARRAGLLLAARGPQATADVAVPLMRRSEGRALVWACLAASIALGRLGRLAEAVAAADTGYAAQLALPASLEYYPWLHVYFRGDALIYGGAFDAASEAASERYEAAVRDGSSEARAYFGFQLAKAVGERGDVERAIRYSREAALLLRDLGRPALLEACLVDLVVSLALSGEPDEAARVLSELDGLPLNASYYSVEVLRAKAWVAIARGNLAEARTLLDDGARLGEEIGDVVGALEALHTLARIGRAKTALEPATRIGPRVEGPLAEARVAHIEALAGVAFEELHAVSEMFEQLGAYLLAAEAATDAVVAAKNRSTPQRVAVLRRRAAALRERCPNALTPTLEGSVARSELTPSEADAAMLAAAGRSNREIAQKLQISVRTVEGQLQRSYEKLAITRRSELAEALRGRGIGAV
jgi:DNA-binding CsgD family transcriptional regulator